MANTMELFRKLAALEAELRIEKEQHALAQQCITYMARQLATQERGFGTRVFKPASTHLHTTNDGTASCRVGQTYENEDFLTDDGSATKPFMITPLTPPSSINAVLNHSHGIKSSSFVDGAKVEVGVADSKSFSGDSLIAFDSGDDGCGEDAVIPRDSGRTECSRASAEQRQQSTATLSFADLADRYRQQSVVPPGLEASRWAKAENDEKEDVSGDADLMQFPETSEETTKSGIKEMDEATELKHMEELRKNQALVMYHAAPSADAIRTVLATDVPIDVSVADVMALVQGGIVVSIRPMHTLPITGSETIMITFLLAEAAKSFVKSVTDKTKPRFSLLETPAYPVNGYIFDDISYNGVTRCLAMYLLHEDITIDAICYALAESGTSQHGVISAGRDELGVVHIEFCSVVAAQKAQARARRHAFFRFAKIEFEADPCDVPISNAENKKEQDGADTDSMDDEIGKVMEKAKKQTETETGSEEDMEAGAEEVRDAEGWPVGGLNYD